MSKVNKIIVNGKKIIGDLIVGRNIQIRDNVVLIDGKNVTPDSKDIVISIEGDVTRLDVDCCSQITINGSAGYVDTASGDVQCEAVNGDIQTASGDVDAKDVSGDITTVSGDVNCGQVKGSIDTVSGDITRR